MSAGEGQSWLERRATIVVMLAVQAVGLVIWGANLSSRVAQVEAILAQRTPLVERYLRTEADVRHLEVDTTRRLNSIETKLDRVLNRLYPTPSTSNNGR